MRPLVALLLLLIAVPLHAGVDRATATRAFEELDLMCARDRATLWGRPLCGPTMLVDSTTRAFIAKRGDGSVIDGTLPETMGLANTAMEWNGERWTMILLPLPSDAFARRSLLAHESFHRIQPALGFTSDEKPNAHLDSVDGRWLLQLEWRALARALAGDRTAVRDALAFRARRRQLFATSATEEHSLEMNEGLAEYTGVRMAAQKVSERIPYLVTKLHDAESKPTFVRSFAYATIPAWGTLLEMRDRSWTRRLKAADDVSALLNLRAPAQLADHVATAAQRYGGDALLVAERSRDEKRQAAIREFTQTFVKGQRLIIPLKNMRMEFNPNEAQPFPPHGTIYPTLTVHDAWGTVVVHRGGALIASDWSTVTVPAPPSNDYELTLNEGWKTVPDIRPGDIRVAKN